MHEGILELQNAQGIKKKREILRKYSGDEDFCRMLYYALDLLPKIALPENALRLKDTEEELLKTPLVFFDDVPGCCEYLSRLREIDPATLRQIKTLIFGQGRTQEEIGCLLRFFSGSLRLGVTAKTVNRVIPGLLS